MKSNKHFLFLAALVLMLAGCSHRAHQNEADQAVNDAEEIKQSIPMQNNQFAFDLIRQVPFEEENFVVSPFSISTALAMTYAGAREATLEQMADVMYFDRNQERFHQAYGEYLQSMLHLAEGNIELNIANSLWAQEDYHFLDSFFSIVEAHYHSETFQVDFEENREQVREDINQWVFDETREKIRDLIGPGILTEDTRLVLVNAIHFLGSWLKEFDKELTRENTFYLRDKKTVMADFMQRSDTLPYYEDDNMQALEIPYAGEDFSMLLVLPSEDTSLEDQEARMDAVSFAELINNLEKTKLEVIIPGFEAQTKLDLEKTLADMGMHKPFSREADFSGMSGDLELKIDRVIHQAMIEVAEEGTEAAAATAVVVIRKTAIEVDQPTVFRANRPFLFFVKDNTNQSILFAGRVMNPEK